MAYHLVHTLTHGTLTRIARVHLFGAHYSNEADHDAYIQLHHGVYSKSCAGGGYSSCTKKISQSMGTSLASTKEA